jgi:hypothetical protein
MVCAPPVQRLGNLSVCSQYFLYLKEATLPGFPLAVVYGGGHKKSEAASFLTGASVLARIHSTINVWCVLYTGIAVFDVLG